MFTIAIKERSVFVTQLGAALSFSDQIIFPSVDRKHAEGGEKPSLRASSLFQVVKSLSQRRGCAHPQASRSMGARYKNTARFSPTSG